MKKIMVVFLAMLLVSVMSFSLIACSNANSGGGNNNGGNSNSGDNSKQWTTIAEVVENENIELNQNVDEDSFDWDTQNTLAQDYFAAQIAEAGIKSAVVEVNQDNVDKPYKFNVAVTYDSEQKDYVASVYFVHSKEYHTIQNLCYGMDYLLLKEGENPDDYRTTAIQAPIVIEYFKKLVSDMGLGDYEFTHHQFGGGKREVRTTVDDKLVKIKLDAIFFGEAPLHLVALYEVYNHFDRGFEGPVLMEGEDVSSLTTEDKEAKVKEYIDNVLADANIVIDELKVTKNGEPGDHNENEFLIEFIHDEEYTNIGIDFYFGSK